MKMNKSISFIIIVGIIIISIGISNSKDVFADPRTYPHFHQYYEPGLPTYQYHQEPQYQLSDKFILTVRFVLEDKDNKYGVGDLWVYTAGEKKLVRSEEFEDDGKAKIKFVLDRDELADREDLTIESADGSGTWDDTARYTTKNYDEYEFTWTFEN